MPADWRQIRRTLDIRGVLRRALMDRRRGVCGRRGARGHAGCARQPLPRRRARIALDLRSVRGRTGHGRPALGDGRHLHRPPRRDSTKQFPWVFKEADLRGVEALEIEIDHTPGRGWFRAGTKVEVHVREPVPDQEIVTCLIPGHHRIGRELFSDTIDLNAGPLVFSVQGRCAYETTFEYSSDRSRTWTAQMLRTSTIRADGPLPLRAPTSHDGDLFRSHQERKQTKHRTSHLLRNGSGHTAESSVASGSSPAENSAMDCRSGRSPTGSRSSERPESVRPDGSAFVNAEASHVARARDCLWAKPGAPTAGAIVSSTRPSLLSRHSAGRVWRASSAFCPAISTPVGPAPTTTNVSQLACSWGSCSSSATSNACRIRPRTRSELSNDLTSSASDRHCSRPKYE